MKDIFFIILNGFITFFLSYHSSCLIEKKKIQKEKEEALRSLITEIHINICSLKLFCESELFKDTVSFKHIFLKTDTWEKYNNLISIFLEKTTFNIVSKWYLELQQLPIKYTNTNTQTTRAKIINDINNLISFGNQLSFLYEVLNIKKN